ncbi:16S rRNA (guanine(966)-N(2))-methyltransferase RsmD [Candidatus Erwinia haradaeae]|uniref:Ribosomal RNA small subunit methyltransferase D n=1 Tax=Candidatus Erwinia haradaeae TaxID=1922217 RepID=A0A451DGL1_9GAMM|nr:16S rRNA (guanine(966)-N(2))-methyltransferase RsmD [Candidatus Erwinia haradaeae]VFP85781.1 Ribosomal RNA small subunit methyltransferase D [Candidatus Erwinia haradaeae]
MYKKKSSKIRRIRIISGQWRGHYISVPDNATLRPTTNRTRETLFNWIAETVIKSTCLDCFSGSGALGLEALSRYASSVTFLEIQRSVKEHLKRTLFTLKAQNGTIIHTNTLKFLSQEGNSYNLVFVDPPFRTGLVEKTLVLLEEHAWLKDNSLIYVESEVEHGRPVTPNNWHLDREILSGQVASRLYYRLNK